MRIQAQPLTAQAFAAFGEVIDWQSKPAVDINHGHTRKFANLAHLHGDGQAVMHRYQSDPATMPFSIERLERHPLGCQAFYPLHQRPFPVVVAASPGIPGPEDIYAFLTNGQQGINLHPGTWHHFQLSLEKTSEYLVVDWDATPGNFEEIRLSRAVELHIQT